MLTPKVLVVICCYNHGKYLKESVQSICVQTYKNLDICIVDDGSDADQCISSIIDDMIKIDDRIRSICLDHNRGKWFCLNEAIKTSSADLCTSHDADDVSLPNRIERQVACLIQTNTLHNLCGFIHCWNEEDVVKSKESHQTPEKMVVANSEEVLQLVVAGKNTPGINHYYTGNFETAGVTALFYKQVWDLGLRFNPPGVGLRTLVSEDSDFNFRVTTLLRKTSILAEKLYCYRRNTSTNQELA